VWFEPRHRHFLRSSFCPNDFCLAWSATESALLMNADRLLMHSLITFEIVVAGIGPSTKARDPEPVETTMPVPCSRFAVRSVGMRYANPISCPPLPHVAHRATATMLCARDEHDADIEPSSVRRGTERCTRGACAPQTNRVPARSCEAVSLSRTLDAVERSFLRDAETGGTPALPVNAFPYSIRILPSMRVPPAE